MWGIVNTKIQYLEIDEIKRTLHISKNSTKIGFLFYLLADSRFLC